jgi:pimeloyl-ACP methyl ester carboxylesterase
MIRDEENAVRIDLDEITINVRDDGAGPAVVLLHGWPDTGDVWRHQVPELVARGYRVIAPDLRGFGASSRPVEISAYAARHLVADVVAVLDHMKIDRAHLVGHDWGAAVAWIAAASVPDRVATLSALSVGHPAAFAHAGLRQLEKSWYMLLFQFAGVAEEWLSANQFRNLRRWSSHPDINEVVERLSDPGALTASLNVYRANRPARSLIKPPRRLPPVKAPTLGVWSSRDLALTEKSMTGSSDYVNGPWRYERMEGVGHWMQLEAADELNALLLDFLSQHRGTAQPPS